MLEAFDITYDKTVLPSLKEVMTHTVAFQGTSDPEGFLSASFQREFGSSPQSLPELVESHVFLHRHNSLLRYIAANRELGAHKQQDYEPRDILFALLIHEFLARYLR